MSTLQDNDDISLRSTSEEAYSKSQVFEVEGIEAETVDDEGNKLYLLKWLGYKPTDNTWEPLDSIQDPETLRLWEQKKLRQSRGVEPRFDVKGWEESLRREEEERANRKRLRTAKRLQLGLSGSQDLGSDSDEAVEIEEPIEDSGASYSHSHIKGGFRKLDSIFHHGSILEVGNSSMDESTRPAQGQNTSKVDSSSAPSNIAEQPQAPKHSRNGSGSSSDVPLARKRPRVDPAIEKPKPFRIPKRSKPSSEASQPQVNKQQRVKTAVRGGSNLSSSRNPRSILDVSKNPNIQPKAYSNMRFRRKAELQARGLGDQAPNVDALGGFYDPSRPEELKNKSPDIRKGSNREVENDLFTRDTPDQPEKPFIAPPYLPPSKPVMDPNIATCFFWDRAQKNDKSPGCTSGIHCSFLHRYETGIPIAAEPDLSSSRLKTTSEAKEQRPTCFFWDLNLRQKGVASCVRGDSCRYDHEHAEGKPIAPDPQLRRESTKTPFPASSDTFAAICYDWFEGRSCTDSKCKYIHANEPNIPIAPKKVPESLETLPLQDAINKVKELDPGSIAKENHSNHPPLDQWEIERRSRLLPERTWADRVDYSKDDLYFATCFYWNRDGHCDRGEDCDYFHRFLDGTPIAPPAEPAKRSVCRYWEEGNCRFTASECRFLHKIPHVETTKVSQEPPVSRAETDLPGETLTARAPATAPFDAQTMHAHVPRRASPERRSEPWISKMGKRQQTCLYWSNGRCFKTARECDFLHEFEENIDTREEFYLAREAPSKEFHAAPIVQRNGRKKIMRPCKFWLDGRCVFVAEDCEFLHYIPEKDSPENRRTKRSGDDYSTTSNGLLEQSALFAKALHEGQAPSYKDNSHFKGHGKFTNSSEDQGIFFDEPATMPADEHQQDALPLRDISERSRSQQGYVSPSDASVAPSRPKITKSMSLEDYRRRAATDLLAAQAKEIIFGASPSQSNAFVVDFRDIMRLQDAQNVQDLLTITKIRLDSMTMAHDVEMYASASNVLWKSDVKLTNPTEAQLVKFDNLTMELESRLCGMAQRFRHVLLLVYPRVAQWAFLEGRDAHERENLARLQMAILPCQIDVGRSKLKPGVEETMPESVPARKVLMKNTYRLEFKNLFPHNQSTKQHHVFMMFPPNNDTEAFLTSWLFASCADDKLKVFSGQQEGSWHHFTSTMKENSTASLVLVHEFMTAQLVCLPDFANLIRQNTSLMFRSISDSGTSNPIYPSKYSSLQSLGESDTKTLGHIRNTLLLPHGHAFFLPPSLVVTEPEKVLAIVNWFLNGPSGKYATSIEGTWKMVTCHNFADYVLNVAVSKAEEKVDFERKNRDKPWLDQKIEDKGLDFGTCKVRYALHAKIMELASRGVVKLDVDKDSAGPDDEYNPIVYAPSMINPDNEQLLVEWFASWALQRLDRYRRFTVVGSLPERATRASRIIEVDDEQKTSNSHLAQTSVESQVLRMIAKDQDPGTPAHSSSGNQTPSNGSSRFSFTMPTSKMSSPSDATSTRESRETDSHSSSRRGSAQEKGGWRELSKAKRELVYEATTTWYERLRSGGGGYGHVFVAGWPQALENLGMSRTRR